MFGLFSEVFGHLLAYIGLLFMALALIVVDNGIHLTRYEIKKIVEIQENEKQRRLKEQKDKDHAV